MFSIEIALCLILIYICKEGQRNIFGRNRDLVTELLDINETIFLESIGIREGLGKKVREEDY